MSTNGETISPQRDAIRALPASVSPVNLRDDGEPDRRPVLSGHFARFGEWTEIDSWFEGRFMERIMPNAFTKTFSERRDQLRVLFQHGKDPMVGDKPIAEIMDLRADEQGAYHESRLLDGVPDLIVSGLRAGQYGQSFRMEVLREDLEERPERSDHNPHGLPERSITEIRLHEFGPVTFPAYGNTTPQLRSMTDDFIFRWIERNPQRARQLMTGADLSAAAMRSADPEPSPTIEDPAPVEEAGAARESTPAPTRRDPSRQSALIRPTHRQSVLYV